MIDNGELVLFWFVMLVLYIYIGVLFLGCGASPGLTTNIDMKYGNFLQQSDC